MYLISDLQVGLAVGKEWVLQTRRLLWAFLLERLSAEVELNTVLGEQSRRSRNIRSLLSSKRSGFE